MIEVDSLHKSFGKVVAVDGVSFVARGGEVTGLLGPNGAGKTTSLRMVAGLVRPDRGSVRVDGQGCAAARRRLGVLPEASGVYARLTAREHLLYAGRLHGVPEGTLADSVRNLLARLGMEGFADRPAEGFSLGERRKLALARALVHDPPNVLLDEPTVGLDVPAARAVRGLVKELAAAGRCVLFSSHVMPEVSLLCDRVVVVARGRVAAEGTPAELLSRTGKGDLESAFVALIGSEEGLL